jgi:hypothetical protein
MDNFNQKAIGKDSLHIPYKKEPVSKIKKYFAGIVIAMITLVTTYMVHTHPELQLADLIGSGPSGDLGDTLYVPNYEGGIGEEGLLEVKSKTPIDGGGEFDSFTFEIHYSPIDALLFEQNPIVFDSETRFQNAAFQMTAEPEDGKLIVTIVLDDSVTVSDPAPTYTEVCSDFDSTTQLQCEMHNGCTWTAGPDTCTGTIGISPAIEDSHPTLFKLKTQLSDTVSQGQVVNLSYKNVSILDGTSEVTVPALPNSRITVQGGDELKVLRAEAIDSTHVALHFSDFLQDIGNSTAYVFDPALIVSDVESGTLYGYDQKVAVLTTAAAMMPGQEYVVSIDPVNTISSNTQGTVDDDFNTVVFHGYGNGVGAYSDFAMTEAKATGYNTLEVSFSHDVQPSSVTKGDFVLTQEGGGPLIIANVSSVTGNKVVLTTSENLLKANNYVIESLNPDSIIRSSDGAELGLDRTAFIGYKNGPRIIGATVSQVSGEYRAQITFDEPIQLGGVADNPVGTLFNSYTSPGSQVDDTNSATYQQSISGSTITLTNAIFNASNTNFAFVVSDLNWILNQKGIPVDPAYDSATFWGYGHQNSINSVGTPLVTKKDVVEIPGGTLDFSDIDISNVSILYNDGSPNLQSELIDSVTAVNDNLEIVTSSTMLPGRHYIVRIASDSNQTLAVKEFVIKPDLHILSAEAVNDEDIRIFFSENIDERDVDSGDFEVNDGGLILTGMTIDPGYESAVLETPGPLSPSSVYKVEETAGDVYSYDGNGLGKRIAFFPGFQTTAKSDVFVTDVNTLSSSKLRLAFSDDISESSFTPVNLNIFRFTSPSTREKLTVTDVTRVNSNTYELTISVQEPGKNYFIIFDGVKDADGLTLGNAEPVNFFGFDLPKASVSVVTPSVISNDVEGEIVLSGQNLDVVDTVRLNSTDVNIISKTPTSIAFSVPVNFEAGLYDIELIDQSNNVLVTEEGLLVIPPESDLEVVSSESKAIPFNVPNDGETKTKLWLLVKDPVDLNGISSVVVDLSQIGGPSTQEMNKDLGTQPQFSQWYTYEVTVPPTVATSDIPYELPVEVRRRAEVYEGTVSVRVTNDILHSNAPVINSVYVNPGSIAPDSEDALKISAQVSDSDGASTISSVVADLGALGVGFVNLTAVGDFGETESNELTTQFFESEEFTLPDTVEEGTYTINVVASDATGEQSTESTQLLVSSEISGPNIDQELSYISPRTSIPNDNKTEFSIHVYITDTDGIEDVQSVTANFGTIGLPPVSLSKDAEASGDTNSAWYSAEGLKIPKTAPRGMHDINVRASDKDGGTGSIRFQVEVTHKDMLGDPPRLIEDRSYTNPKIAINDGKTPITLYAFVRDDDDDIESVIANLSGIGQVGEESADEFTATGSGNDEEGELTGGNCPTGSKVIVCMNPSVKEGADGQWYILSGVTISKDTVPSPNPYQVEVIMTDSGGKTTRGNINVFVSDKAGAEGEQVLPQALMAIPTSPTSVEVVFNKEIATSSVARSGRGFTITDSADISQQLPIVGATINASGNIVTLSTANQVEGNRYVLSVSEEIKDISGRSVVEGVQNRLAFTGFKPLNKAPIVDYITATDIDEIEIEFRDKIKPSSVITGFGLDDYGIEVYETENTANRLKILGVEIVEPGNILRITTEPQKANTKYRVNISGLSSYDGTRNRSDINKGFVGYNIRVAQHLAAANLADLNNDGRVDFADFTIFSSVYGTVYYGEEANVHSAASSSKASVSQNTVGRPLEPDPNSTVPHSSEVEAGDASETDSDNNAESND